MLNTIVLKLCDKDDRELASGSIQLPEGMSDREKASAITQNLLPKLGCDNADLQKIATGAMKIKVIDVSNKRKTGPNQINQDRATPLDTLIRTSVLSTLAVALLESLSKRVTLRRKELAPVTMNIAQETEEMASSSGPDQPLKIRIKL